MFTNEEYAEAKALLMLKRSLTNSQLMMFERYHYFAVKGGDTGFYYLIAKKGMGGILVGEIQCDPIVKRWKICWTFCVHFKYDEANERLPWPDRMLAYKKLIESKHGEAHFRFKANPMGYTTIWLEPDFVL